ncbi:MAG: response regulator transcription factor [Thermoleophilia bacterium]|nr:response regulator transcription factor [Thermoleophilia bacterium]
MAGTPTVLVVEDDADLRELLREVLERAGMDVREAGDGREALEAVYRDPPDLVVLDLVMPEVDGWETLARLRDATAAPVLVLSARAGEVDKVRALRAGADDYVTKPFGRHELVARIEALLRRANGGARRKRYADPLLAFDFVTRSVTAEGREVRLTPLEYRMLTALVEHAGATLTHAELLELARGTAAGGSPAQVRLYVNYLRRKLGGRTADAIETVRGFGYRYRPPAG